MATGRYHLDPFELWPDRKDLIKAKMLSEIVRDKERAFAW
jgi:hypothetical protein